MSHYGSSSGCLSSDHFDLFLKVYFIHGDYYPQVLGNSSCQWLAWSWLYVMEWIYILKCKLLVGLYLEIVVRRVVPLCWEWCPYMGRWERPFFVLPPFSLLCTSIWGCKEKALPANQICPCQTGTSFLNFPSSIMMRNECFFLKKQKLSVAMCYRRL